MQRSEQGGGRQDNLTIQGDAAFDNHPLDFAAGCDTGAGEEFRDTLWFRLAAGIGGSARRMRIGWMGCGLPGFAGSGTGWARATACTAVNGFSNTGLSRGARASRAARS